VLDVEVLRLVPDLDADLVARVVDAAAALGAPNLLVVNSALEPGAATDALGRVVELARGSGVRPCLEPMLFSQCRTLGDAVATAAPAGAGVLVDALHLARAGDGPTDVAEAVRRHGPGLFPYAQLCDAPETAPLGDDALRDEAVTDRLLPGDGVLPLPELLQALPARVPLSVEAPTRALADSPAAVRASAAAGAARRVLAQARVRG
jgi:sugar phosphate isomerase/epimerase